MYSMNFLAITTVVLALIILYRVIRVSVYDFKKTHVKKRILKFKQKNVKAGKVSVIILAENNKKTIVECLNSLFRSTIRKIEVIVIDNKSTDGTQQIVREYLLCSICRFIVNYYYFYFSYGAAEKTIKAFNYR